MKRISEERVRELAWNLRAGGRLRLSAEWCRMPAGDRAYVGRALRRSFDGWRAEGFRGRLTVREGYVVCRFV